MQNRPASRLTTRAPNNATYEDRAALHSTVDEAGCWHWIGHVSNGVPRVGRRAEPGKRPTPVNLRVVLLEERDGTKPEDAYAAVADCGSEDCVNPAHLKWETRDQFFGRVASIVRVHSQKLSDDRYRQAWDLHRTGMTVKDVAARFSVSRQTLYANWKRLGLRRNQG
jgi:hypothetical protein